MIDFRYSNIYDINLAKWSGEKWDFPKEVEGKKYSAKLKNHWNNIELSVKHSFEQMNLPLPERITVYIVSPWPQITAFSDPMTIPIFYNSNKALIKIIHELIHVALSFKKNQATKKNVYQHIDQHFKEESYATKIHIAVNLIQQTIINEIPSLITLLDEEKLEPESLYPGQKKAWELLEKIKNNKNIKDPIDFLLKL